MSQYEAVINPADPNLSHTAILEQVGENKTVLDLGCASGYLAEALVARGCTVSGVEYDAVEAEKARPHLDRLVVADLNHLDLTEEFSATRFDVVVCGDVLEHLLSPAEVLRAAASLLAPGGSVVISLPNVAHGSLRLALVAGEWNYTPLGLLDETHIKFFTYGTLKSLVEGVGMVIEEARYTVADALSTEVKVPTEELPAEIIDWVRSRPFADAYQFIVRAVVRSDAVRASEADAAVAALPAVVRPVVEDQFSDAAQQLRDEREETAARVQELDERVVELELEREETAARAQQFDERVVELELERDNLYGIVDGVVADRHDMLRSVTWRAGRVLVGPVARVRRLLGR